MITDLLLRSQFPCTPQPTETNETHDVCAQSPAAKVPAFEETTTKKYCNMPVECWQIDSSPLDRIHVFWMDVAPGKGYVTIICYGQAWTAYFGAMSGSTIREFFAMADVGYLSSKLGITQHLKQGKRHEKYLESIIVAVKAEVLTRAAEDAQGGAK